MPVATGMFGKASAGEQMMRDFKPIMATDSVKVTTTYYQLFKGVGTDFGPMMTGQNVGRFQGYMDGLNGMSSDMRKFMASFGQQMRMTPAQVQGFMKTNYPALAGMLAAIPELRTDMGGMVGVMGRDVQGFGQVAPALKHFQKLTAVMQRNVGNFASANKLQPMGLLPWYFEGIGGVLVLLGAALLCGERKSAKRAELSELPVEHVRAA